MGTVQLPSHDPALRIAWCRDVLYLVDRHTHAAPNEPVVGPVTITDPNLSRLVQYAVPIILSLASTQPPQAEALYLRATLAASGAFPDQLSHNHVQHSGTSSLLLALDSTRRGSVWAEITNRSTT